jgi:hypothetical protein
MSEIMKSFGIDKRLGKATLIYKKYKNAAPNRYAQYMIMKLKRIDSDTKFWKIADILLRRSTVFFYLALKHVYPN